MAFNPYTGSPAAAAAPPATMPDRSPSFRSSVSGFGASQAPQRPKRQKVSGPGVRRRGSRPTAPQTPTTPPMPPSLSRPAMMPQSRLSPEGGIPGVQDIGQAAAMGRVPGVGQPGVMNRFGGSPRRKGPLYGA
jgi:hypothetical protein